MIVQVERTATVILNELIEEADEHYLFRLVDSMRRDHSGEVGKLVQALSEADREILKELSADDIEKKFAAYKRARPEQPTHRVRGPITLSKGNK